MYLVDLDDPKDDKLSIKNMKDMEKLDEKNNIKRHEIDLINNGNLRITGADYNNFESTDMIHIDKMKDEAHIDEVINEICYAFKKIGRTWQKKRKNVNIPPRKPHKKLN